MYAFPPLEWVFMYSFTTKVCLVIRDRNNDENTQEITEPEDEIGLKNLKLGKALWDRTKYLQRWWNTEGNYGKNLFTELLTDTIQYR